MRHSADVLVFHWCSVWNTSNVVMSPASDDIARYRVIEKEYMLNRIFHASSELAKNHKIIISIYCTDKKTDPYVDFQNRCPSI